VSSGDRPAIAIIVNPIAGRGRGRRVAEVARAFLEGHGCKVRIRVTTSADDVSRQTRAALADGVDRIAVAGGDGTLNQAACAMAGADAALALLPCGRGNDLARALAIPSNTRDAARLLLTGRLRSVDLAGIEDRRFTTAASFGLDAEVASMAHRGAVPGSGRLAYLLASIAVLARARPLSARFMLVAAANTRSYGGGIVIAPDADPSDGLLDVCMVRAVPRRVAGVLFARLLLGRHTAHPAVRIARTRTLRIETDEPRPLYADGEPFGTTPATIAVSPGALRLLTP